MHAASVNPEPGSNSLKNSILNPKTAAPGLKTFFRAIYLSFFLLFEFLNVFLSLTRIAQFSA